MCRVTSGQQRHVGLSVKNQWTNQRLKKKPKGDVAEREQEKNIV